MTREPRARCYRCLRPEAHCLCADLRPVPTRTGLLILQHPRERLHPFGTARIARLMLPAARVVVPYPGWNGTLACACDVPADAAVLYPHRDAVDLETLPVGERPSTLVVLDGTWAHAKRLYGDNEWLRGLRHVRLRPASPSNYRIRKEPQADYVSTVEAIVQALRILEPENARTGELLVAFDRMVDRQIAHLDAVPRHGRTHRPRQRDSRAVAPALRAPDVVLVYAETSLPGGDGDAERELVQWAAVRARDGAAFDAVLRPRGAGPTQEHLRHMQLDADALRAGLARDDAVARFRTFAGDAPLAAWTTTAFGWGSAFAAGHTTASLKRAWCNLHNRRSGFLEHIVAGLQLPLPEVACRGRAGPRLANALALLRWLAAARSDATNANG